MSANELRHLQPAATRFSPEEWEARLDLAAAYRLAARNGWHDLLGTHFSLRVPGTSDQYLVNPAGFFFEEITASSLVKIDTRGNVLSDSPYGVNPAADDIHGAILSARPDIHAVMHLHSVAGTGVSIQKNGLLPISQNALILLNRVRYYDYGGAGLDEAECARLVAALGDGSVLFMRNHGTLAAGRTIGEAFALITRIERACQIQIAAQAGGELTDIDPEVKEKTITRGRRNYSDSSWSPGARVEWAAFRRKVDRDDPSYAS
jgi:ribulose-5-phosphate 4-epimerase/fuculose-1-phosphate aldolase